LRSHILYAAATTVAVIWAASTAHAAPSHLSSTASTAASVTVPVADLNLASPTGALAALIRIHDAASHLCAGHDAPTRLDPFRQRTCVRATMDRSVADANVPTMTALNTTGSRPMMIATAR